MLTEVASERRFLRGLRYIHRLFGWVFFGLLVAILINTYVITFFRVDGESMAPTLAHGKMVPVLKVAYLWAAPQKGDLVVVEYGNESSVRFVKRIVAIPGETVDAGGQQITLQENEYFMAGDNRDHSIDSRVYGPYKKHQIVGKVEGSYPVGPLFP